MFYAVFGLPLGRLADGRSRTRLIGLGLGFWSVMTPVSGLAGSFAQLAIARVGVGIGEASASPAAYSLLSDLFSERRRATALAIYQSGIHIGAGLGLRVGGPRRSSSASTMSPRHGPDSSSGSCTRSPAGPGSPSAEWAPIAGDDGRPRAVSMSPSSVPPSRSRSRS